MAKRVGTGSGIIKSYNSRFITYLSIVLLAAATILIAAVYFLSISAEGNVPRGLTLIKVAGPAIIFMLLVAIVAVYVSYKLALKPVDRITDYARTISGGNLNISDIIVREKGSLGDLARAFNDMKSNLLFFVEQTNNNILVISESLEKLTKNMDSNYKGSKEIADTVEDVALKAREQLNLVKRTKVNIEGVYKSLDKILAHLKDTDETARNTSTITLNGLDSINEYNKQIDVIAGNIDNTYDFICKMRSSIEEITGIIGFITDISEQLKLLALNASIEAARAGEAGKGFAVVAQETSNLSQAAKQGIEKISQIVTSVMDSSRSVEDSINNCRDNFSRSFKVFSGIKEMFNDINGESSVILDKMKEISEEASHINLAVKDTTSLSKELYDSSDAVSQSTGRAASVIQDGLSGLKEISESAGELSLMLDRIEKLTSKFNTSIKPVDGKPSRKLKIGAIYPYNSNFWYPVRQGIMFAGKELAGRDVLIDRIEICDVKASEFVREFRRCIDERYDGIAVVGFFKEIIPLINEAAQKDIAVMTLNSDLEARRMAYFGQDSYSAGMLAGEIMINELKGEGKIITVTDNSDIYDHELRKKGFQDKIRKAGGIKIVADMESRGNNDEICRKVKEVFGRDKDIKGIFTTVSGTLGVARAVEELCLEKKVKYISFDFTDKNVEYVKKGVISHIIGQDPFSQGHDPIIYIYNYLITGSKPNKDKMWTRMQVVDINSVNDIIF